MKQTKTLEKEFDEILNKYLKLINNHVDRCCVNMINEICKKHKEILERMKYEK